MHVLLGALFSLGQVLNMAPKAIADLLKRKDYRFNLTGCTAVWRIARVPILNRQPE